MGYFLQPHVSLLLSQSKTLKKKIPIHKGLEKGTLQ